MILKYLFTPFVGCFNRFDVIIMVSIFLAGMTGRLTDIVTALIVAVASTVFSIIMENYLG